MPLIALGMVLLAAVMHAAWNLLIKRARYKQPFTWLALSTGSCCALVFLLSGPALSANVWPYALVSAFVEMLYYIALTIAYDSDDFSLIYPIARGAAPALLALWAALFLQQSPSLLGLMGIILIVCGLIVVGAGSTFARLKEATFSAKGIIAALLTALFISVYSAIDGAAVRFAPPTSYTILVFLLTSIMLTPVIFIRYGTRIVFAEARANSWRVIVVGILMLLAYGLVLHAYALARISYAGSLREVSIVFAAIAGSIWLGEKFGLTRTLGAICIFIGMVLIAVLG